MASQPTAVVARATSSRATLAGLGAVALWSALTTLSVVARDIPPFQLTAMAFAVGTLVGLTYVRATGQSIGALRHVPMGAWALGLYGLLGFHVCYFAALRAAPPLEASLINYLCPLLIVIFAGLLPLRLGGRRLRWQHVLGAAIAFSGSAVILLAGRARPDFSGALAGYGLALAASLIWSTYSVASRFYRDVPSTAVTGFCAGTAVGAAAIHLALETWVWPTSSAQWMAIGAIGLGPLGLAFYLWDEGMKHGDMVQLGLASYATPLLSTVILAAAGLGTLSPSIAAATLLVTAGAIVAGRAAEAPDHAPTC